jgi:hypothetical protein
MESQAEIPLAAEAKGKPEGLEDESHGKFVLLYFEGEQGTHQFFIIRK